MLLVWFGICVSGTGATVHTDIRLSPVFDCTTTTHEKVYAFESVTDCEFGGKQKNTKAFRAKVLKSEPKTTTIRMAHCSATQVSLTCKEKFFGSIEERKVLKKIKVTPKQCKMAARYRQSPYGPLRQTRPHTDANG